MTDKKLKLRSQHWWDNPDNPQMTSLYLERYMNFGLTMQELRSGKPVIGIAQTGSDLSPCNKIHQDLARRVRDGIRDAGGLPLEFPVHPIQETVSNRRRGPDGWVRQNDTCAANGGRYGGSAVHCPVGRPNARWVV